MIFFPRIHKKIVPYFRGEKNTLIRKRTERLHGLRRIIDHSMLLTLERGNFYWCFSFKNKGMLV